MTLDRSHWAASNRSNAEPAIKHSEDASLGHVFRWSGFASCAIICIRVTLGSIGEKTCRSLDHESTANRLQSHFCPLGSQKRSYARRHGWLPCHWPALTSIAMLPHRESL